MLLNKFDLHFFDLNTNVTGDSGMTAEMKTFYDKSLITMTTPALIHDQFAQMRDIPKNAGKTIEFRKFVPLAKALTPLSEGVTPSGKKLTASSFTATVAQYGDFVAVSDIVSMSTIDNIITERQRELADQAGRTMDTITRDVINAGTNVLFAGSKLVRANMVAADKFSVELSRQAVRKLKLMNAKKIDGYWVAIIHPNVSYDLMGDAAWVSASEYAGSMQIFEGEIGKLFGTRYIETTEAKIWRDDTCPVLTEAVGADPGPAADATYYSVYSTLVLGADFYGTTKIEGGGLEFIFKPLGSGDDPLNQRGTAGWKAIKVSEILVQEYGVRIETVASYNEDAN